MKKATLGLVLAMMLATVPVTLFATSAGAAGESTVHIIYANNGNVPSKISISGTSGLTLLGPSQAFDASLAAGTYTVLACTDTTTSVTGTTCNGGALITGATNNLNISSNGNYTLLLETGAPAAGFQYQNDLNITGLNEARFTANNGTGVNVDICINSVKVISNLVTGFGQAVALPAQQTGQLAVVAPAGPPCGTSNGIPLVAGTNFVLTLANASPAATVACSSACTQVLVVGQDTVPNIPETVAFCDAVLSGLSGVQPALKALVGNVDPTSVTTITNTQPSVGDMMTFVNDTQAALDAGDASVPASIQPAWVTATASIRGLLTGFKLVNFNLVGLGQPAVKSLVLGANGVVLPGVPPNEDIVGAQEDLTAFLVANCLASGTPGAEPTAATPVAAAARFTG